MRTATSARWLIRLHSGRWLAVASARANDVHLSPSYRRRGATVVGELSIIVSCAVGGSFGPALWALVAWRVLLGVGVGIGVAVKPLYVTERTPACGARTPSRRAPELPRTHA